VIFLMAMASIFEEAKARNRLLAGVGA